MIPITSLRDIHAGWPGAVLGGGPSLRDDVAQLPRNTVRISVNQHGLGSIVESQFLVFMDDPARNPILLLAAQEPIFFSGRINHLICKVSPLSNWSDMDLTGADWWEGSFSSHLATWLACWMGCDPVLLCGMDCYQGKRSADANPRDNAYNIPLEEHLAGWRQAFEKCPNADRIKAVSGPLIYIFGKY